MLHRVVDGTGPDTIALVHGFTQTHRSWDEVAGRLAATGRFRVVRVDLPGHGGSAHLRPGFVETAGTLADAVDGPAVYAGYSMGGRLSLRMALDRPDAVRSLVLIGASPGIEDAAAREHRRRSDALLAADLERDGTTAFLRAWLAQPMFETTTPPEDDLAARRANPADGLAYALRTLGSGSQEPLWDRLGALRMPVLLVAGAWDAKFRTIAERMAAAIGPPATTAWVDGAGHAVPLDQPEVCASLIAAAAGHAATR